MKYGKNVLSDLFKSRVHGERAHRQYDMKHLARKQIGRSLLAGGPRQSGYLSGQSHRLSTLPPAPQTALLLTGAVTLSAADVHIEALLPPPRLSLATHTQLIPVMI
jgi:hypothetical protein